MNKHKLYWSNMGLEENIEQSYISQLREKHKIKLKRMMEQYNQDGFNELVSILRGIKEEQQ